MLVFPALKFNFQYLRQFENTHPLSYEKMHRDLDWRQTEFVLMADASMCGCIIRLIEFFQAFNGIRLIRK